jgi:WXG100 family type VII secretion target
VTDGFRIRPDQLSDVVDQIGRFDKHLEKALEQADVRVNGLHATWTGVAAEAHRAAHDQWKRGAEEMRAALNVMHRIAATAHGNYTGAATANTAMWEQV